MTDYDIPGTPFWAEINRDDEAEGEWAWTIWITDPENDDALVDVDSGVSSSETEAKDDVELAAKDAMESWGLNDER